jgi:WD40 repeat protein
LCVGLSEFGAPSDTFEDEEPDEAEEDFRERLGFAEPLTRELAKTLEDFGYEAEVHGSQSLPTAEMLGQEVRKATVARGPGAVQIVHVLSHGYQGETGHLYVVGSDSNYDDITQVGNWLLRVQDKPDAPVTLFLIDTCYGGTAARPPWRYEGNTARAWVIAGAEPDGAAYGGRFTKAVTTVLRRIHEGEDIFPDTYIKFEHIVLRVRAELRRQGGEPQSVFSTLIDGAAPELPFFLNSRQPTTQSMLEAKQAADPAALPFLDLDVALDPAHCLDRHFLERAAGHPDVATRGTFTGRADQLRRLSEWLERGDGGLCVVTGGAGSGKSALLGIVVCTTLPRLREPTRRLWEHLGDVVLPVMPGTAAVHLRERSADDMVAALVRQLVLPKEISGPDEAVRAISRLPQTPLIIVDAVDEAVDQRRLIEELLLPLARTGRDGRPVCRLLVGMRPWQEFAALADVARRAGGLINLDEIAPERLRTDLTDYVKDLLELTPGYGERRHKALRGVLAEGISAAVTRPGASRGGEFLSTALFVNWLRTAHPDGISEDEAAEIADRVPATVPEIMELDLGIATGSTWLRPILIAIAHAYGDGMPALVIRRLAPVFAADPRQAAREELTVQEFDEALGRIRFYLRSSRDSDGTSLYRLFHQGLADHLRSEPADLNALVDRLLRDVPPAQRGGQRGWAGAEPYVVRHAGRHGIDAGRMELVADLGRNERESLFNTTRTRRGRLAAATFRETDKEDLAGAERRDLLAVNAARYGIAPLAAGLARAPGLPAPAWWPSFATGGGISSVPEAVFAAHHDSVWAVAYAELDGRPVAVTGGDDGAVRVWDLTSRQPKGEPMRDHQSWVRGVACAVLDDRAVVVSTGRDGLIRMWDLATQRPVRAPIRVGRKPITALAVTSFCGRPIALTCGTDHTVRLWDLADWCHLRTFTGHTATVRAVTCTVLDGQQVAVSVDDDATLRVWRLGDLGEDLTITGARNTVTCTTVNGEPVAVTAGTRPGTIRVWDLRSGLSRHELKGHNGQVGALDWAELNGLPVAVSGGEDQTIRVWDLETGRQLQTIRGHTGTIRAVACSPSQPKILISAGDDRTARLWELSGMPGPAKSPTRLGHTERDLECQVTGPVRALVSAVIDDRPTVVMVGRDAVAMWDVEHSVLHDTPISGCFDPAAVACAKFGGQSLLIVGGSDGRVRATDLADGQIGELTPKVHERKVVAAACGVVGGLPVAATASAEGVVCLWNLTTYRRLRARRFTWHATALAFTEVAGHPSLLATSATGALHLLDRRLHSIVRLSPDIASAAHTVDCLHNGDTAIAVTGHAGAANVWDLDQRQQIGTLPVQREVARVACVELPDQPIVVLNTDTTLSMWDLRHHKTLAELDTTFIAPPDLAVFSDRDDHTVNVIGFSSNRLRAHEFTLAGPAADRFRPAPGGSPVRAARHPASQLGEVVTGHTSPVAAVALGRVGSRHVMVVTDENGQVILWDLNSGSARDRFPSGHQLPPVTKPGPVTAVCALEGELAVIVARDQRIWRWMPPLTRSMRIRSPVYALCCIDLDDQPMAVVGGESGLIRVADLTKWQFVTQFRHELDRVCDLECHRDGRRASVLAAGPAPGGSAVHVFALPGGTRIGTLDLPGEEVTRIRVIEVERVPHLVTLNTSGNIQIWDLTAGQVVGGRLGGHTASFRAMGVGSVDGVPVIVTGADDRSVRVWSLATREQLASIRMPGPVQAVGMGRQTDIVAAFGTDIAYLRRVRS